MNDKKYVYIYIIKMKIRKKMLLKNEFIKKKVLKK